MLKTDKCGLPWNRAGCDNPVLYSPLDMLRLIASDWTELVRLLGELSSPLNLSLPGASITGPKAVFLEPIREELDY